MKKFVWAILALAVIGGGALLLYPRVLPVELGQAEVRTVQEYISEEAETRLADDYLIDMPVSGTITGLNWIAGDMVAEGDVLATVVDHGLEEQIRGLEAMITQAEAYLEGVDIAKPKPKELEAAAVGVEEAEKMLRIAEREHELARINYNEARKDYDRMTRLRDEGAVSEREFDEAERVYKSAEQNLQRARLAEQRAEQGLQQATLQKEILNASVDDNEYLRDVYQAEIENLQSQLDRFQRDLKKSTIEAPVDGPILEKFVDNDRALAVGTPLLRVGDMSSIEIECDVLSEEIGQVAVGDLVEITGKALRGGRIIGKVKRIYPAAFRKISALGIEQQRVKTLISFDNSKEKLRPGTDLDVRIITEEKAEALAVPERSLVRREDAWHVFLANDGVARLTPVEVGLKNDNWAEITEGVSEGDTIVFEPKNELEDGMWVSATEN